MIPSVLSVGGLGLTLIMLLWLFVIFSRLGNGRFLYLRRFIGLQTAAYALAVVGNFAGESGDWWLAIARALTPVSYAYLVWGTRRKDLDEGGPSRA